MPKDFLKLKNIMRIKKGLSMNNKLMEAIKELLLSDYNEGCTTDLTVVSAKAIENLRKEYEKEMMKK